MSDIDASIPNLLRAILLTDDGHLSKTMHLSTLGLTQMHRFEYFGQRSDIKVSISSYCDAAQSKTANPSQAFSAARQWANISHQNNDLFFACLGFICNLCIVSRISPFTQFHRTVTIHSRWLQVIRKTQKYLTGT